MSVPPGELGATLSRATRVSRAALALFFFSLPFHRPPLTTALGPALALPDLLFLAGGPLLLLAWLRRRPATTAAPGVPGTPVGGLLLALVLLAGLAPSVLLAADRGRALAQLAVLIYVAMIHQSALLAQALGLRRTMLRALVAGSALACALGLAGVAVAWGGGSPVVFGVSLATSYPWMPIARPLGPTESPTMLALIALAGATGAWTLARESGWSSRRRVALLALFGLVLLLSQSRVLPAALAGAALALAATRSPPRRSPLLRPAARVVVGAMVLLLAASLWWRVVPIGGAFPFFDRSPGPYRVCHEIAWSMFRTQPLAGVGLENFHRFWPAHYLPARHDPAYAGGAEHLRGRPLDPHGTFQGYLAEGGLPGLAVVVVIAALMWRRRRRQPEVLAFHAALLLAAFFTDLLTERSTFALLGLLHHTHPPDRALDQGPDSPSATLHIDGEPVDVLAAGPPPRPGGS